MKIVSWNCRGASDRKGFSKEKIDYITSYKADIYVIQECKENDINNLEIKNKVSFCDGKDSNYGIGIFSNNFNITILPEHNKDYRYLVPFKVSNKDCEFILFAVWAKNKNKENKDYSYTKQVWDAINFDGYIKFLEGSVLFIGDFNSNNFWENEYKRNKVPSHQNIIEKLSEYGIESTYHKYYNCDNGKEKNHTLLHMMDKNKKFHIDYCFASKDFIIEHIEIGNIAEWERVKISDHCPLFIDLNK